MQWLCGLGRLRRPKAAGPCHATNEPPHVKISALADHDGANVDKGAAAVEPPKGAGEGPCDVTERGPLALLDHPVLENLPDPVSLISAENGEILGQNGASVALWGQLPLGLPHAADVILGRLFEADTDLLHEVLHDLSEKRQWRGLLRVRLPPSSSAAGTAPAHADTNTASPHQHHNTTSVPAREAVSSGATSPRGVAAPGVLDACLDSPAASLPFLLKPNPSQRQLQHQQQFKAAGLGAGSSGLELTLVEDSLHTTSGHDIQQWGKQSTTTTTLASHGATVWTSETHVIKSLQASEPLLLAQQGAPPPPPQQQQERERHVISSSPARPGPWSPYGSLTWCGAEVGQQIGVDAAASTGGSTRGCVGPSPLLGQHSGQQQQAMLQALTTSAWSTMLQVPRARRPPRRNASAHCVTPTAASSPSLGARPDLAAVVATTAAAATPAAARPSARDPTLRMRRRSTLASLPCGSRLHSPLVQPPSARGLGDDGLIDCAFLPVFTSASASASSFAAAATAAAGRASLFAPVDPLPPPRVPLSGAASNRHIQLDSSSSFTVAPALIAHLSSGGAGSPQSSLQGSRKGFDQTTATSLGSGAASGGSAIGRILNIALANASNSRRSLSRGVSLRHLLPAQHDPPLAGAANISRERPLPQPPKGGRPSTAIGGQRPDPQPPACASPGGQRSTAALGDALADAVGTGSPPLYDIEDLLPAVPAVPRAALCSQEVGEPAVAVPVGMATLLEGAWLPPPAHAMPTSHPADYLDVSDGRFVAPASASPSPWSEIGGEIHGSPSVADVEVAGLVTAAPDSAACASLPPLAPMDSCSRAAVPRPCDLAASSVGRSLHPPLGTSPRPPADFEGAAVSADVELPRGLLFTIMSSCEGDQERASPGEMQLLGLGSPGGQPEPIMGLLGRAFGSIRPEGADERERRVAGGREQGPAQSAGSAVVCSSGGWGGGAAAPVESLSEPVLPLLTLNMPSMGGASALYAAPGRPTSIERSLCNRPSATGAAGAAAGTPAPAVLPALPRASPAGEEEVLYEERWHEVVLVSFEHPQLKRRVIVLTQNDVSTRIWAEQQLALLMEAEHTLLENIFPHHVIEHIAAAATVDLQPRRQQQPPPPPQRTKSVAGDADAEHSVSGGAPDTAWLPPIRGDTFLHLATSHAAITILFCDIQGFTPMCSQLGPVVVMSFLNDLFTRLDALLDGYGVYKVETIGDCYVAAGGLMHTDEDTGAVTVRSQDVDPEHAYRTVQFAKALLQAASRVKLPTTGLPVKLRVGIHSGPAMSGVVGTRMPRFCLFGDTMNVASRMESTGEAGAIHVSQATRDLVPGEAWECRGGLEVKGKGLMDTFLLRV